MRFVISAMLLAGACAGSSQQQLAETPAAQARARPAEAPPASTSDKDRSEVVQQFDDMQTTQEAYREANRSSATKAKQKPVPIPTEPPPPKKKGPAEQAPPRTR